MSQIQPMQTFDVVADQIHMPECPRWHDGQLWFSDIRGHTVCGIDGDDVTVVHRFPDAEEPAGLGWLPNGDLLVVGMAGRVVYRMIDGQPHMHADLRDFAAHQVNDMVVDSQGTAYITQLGFDLNAPEPLPELTTIIRVSSDGTVSAAAEDMMVPNGIALDAAERTLVVAESGAARLSRFTVTNGALSDRVHEALPGTESVPFSAPDGICLDEQGGRWVADSINQRVFRIADGVVTHEHHLGQFVLACVLGGRDRRSLYVCVTDTWHRSDVRDYPTGRIVRLAVDIPGAGKP